MNTLKLGSKGEDVKILQKYLGLMVDGIFGIQTELKVKAWQKSKGLVADGIIGTKSWDIILKESNLINITNGFIKTHITKSINRPIKYIAIHYTASRSSKKGSAMAIRNVFLQRNASVDFVVDDATILQVNPDLKNYYTWGVGDKKNPYTNGGRLNKIATNKNTISIEICSNLMFGYSADIANHEGWYFTDQSINNAIKLVKYLMEKFNIPKENVVRHFDITGKLCPGIIGWNDFNIYDKYGKPTSKKNTNIEWQNFISQL